MIKQPIDGVNDVAEAAAQMATAKERRRIVGVVLAEYARHRKDGNRDAAEALDVLATIIEHPELAQSE